MKSYRSVIERATISDVNVESLQSRARTRIRETLSAFTMVVALIGCNREVGEKGSAAGVKFAVRRELAEFIENGVAVKIAVETDAKSQLLVRARFTPKPGFHLYSKDLPERGINGIGVPTRFVVVTNSSILPTGEAIVDVKPKPFHVKGLGVTLPIYPEGPVTFRVPIQIASGAQDVDTRLLFTYMACKTDGECLRPVERKELTVKVPSLQ